jgi:hypothetical protein
MALDNHMYRDPMLVLEQKQEHALHKQKACTGCVHRRRYEAFGEIVIACTLKRTTAKRICDLYKKENE